LSSDNLVKVRICPVSLSSHIMSVYILIRRVDECVPRVVLITFDTLKRLSDKAGVTYVTEQ